MNIFKQIARNGTIKIIDETRQKRKRSFEPEQDPEEIKICLNCKKSDCKRGTCKDIIEYKRRKIK